jgi:hypothetical protein
MLGGLFLLVAILSDYRAVADILQCGFHFAVFNTGLLLILGSFQVIRRFVPSRNQSHLRIATMDRAAPQPPTQLPITPGTV